MSKNLGVKEWVKIINLAKNNSMADAINLYSVFKNRIYTRDSLVSLRKRIKRKVYLVDNIGMKTLERKHGSGRPKKRDDSDIPSIIDELNEEQKQEILERWIKEQRDKKDKKASINTYSKLTISLKTKITKMHRTSFTKKPKGRKYKFDFLEKEVIEIFHASKGIYGSRKIAIILEGRGYCINDKTLRNYLKRWGIATKTRVAKRKSESKNTNVYYMDLVKRNYNPIKDNIIATDVSYIPANVESNHVYLSVAISHKTKLIESWRISKINNTDLVLDTLKSLKRDNFIIHSDHGTQYSTSKVQEWVKRVNSQTSMSRVGNSLDDREVEYFFGCLKGEYLNHVPTHKMSIEEIEKHIAWYIEWYNTKRIQKRLHWKAPALASTHAI